MLGGGINGFCFDWKRDAVRSFTVTRRISVALAIGIGIFWGDQCTVLVMREDFVVNFCPIG